MNTFIMVYFIGAVVMFWTAAVSQPNGFTRDVREMPVRAVLAFLFWPVALVWASIPSRWLP